MHASAKIPGRSVYTPAAGTVLSVGSVTPNFTISVSPTSGSLSRGQSGYATVTTAVSGGFSLAISLSATGLPSGVTGSFSPNPIAAPGSGTSKFTLTVSQSAKTDTYPITITGTGGGITHTTTLIFEVLRQEPWALARINPNSSARAGSISEPRRGCRVHSIHAALTSCLAQMGSVA